jgi:hypothetical protein
VPSDQQALRAAAEALNGEVRVAVCDP